MSGIVGVTPQMSSGVVCKFNVKGATSSTIAGGSQGGQVLGSGPLGPFPYDSGFRSLTGYIPDPGGVSGTTTMRGYYHRVGTYVFFTCTYHGENLSNGTTNNFQIPFRISDEPSYQPYVSFSLASNPSAADGEGTASAHVQGSLVHSNDYQVNWLRGNSTSGWTASAAHRTMYWQVSYEAFSPLTLNTNYTSPEEWAY